VTDINLPASPNVTSSPYQSPLPGVPLIESPLFEALVGESALSVEALGVARQLHERGYAVLDFPDPDILEIAARIRERYPLDRWSDHWRQHGGDPPRLQDAWQFDEDIRRIAVNPKVLDLLSEIYGRRAFPFQTLAFPLGTQQDLHSDSVHFSSYPERFMCAVWVALEDTDENNGPLIYFPRSHKWPILTNAHFGVDAAPTSDAYAHHAFFVKAWAALMKADGASRERFYAKAGQALIWTANLLHGGDVVKDPARTRYSQVTHYYFEGCSYWTPLLSEPFAGRTFFRDAQNIVTGATVPNMVAGSEIPRWFLETVSPRHRSAGAVSGVAPSEPPPDFDPEGYLRLNPDVAQAGGDPFIHYREFGWNEGRRWR